MSTNSWDRTDMANCMIYEVTDPYKLYHTVICEFDKDYKAIWHGDNNLGHSIDDPDIKWYTIRKLKELMTQHIEGEWNGWKWYPAN